MNFNKLFLRWIAVFGIVMMFAFSGWGAEFRINDVSQNEGNGAGTMTFTVTIDSYCRKNTTYTVDWATANNTAIAGSDYTSSSGTVSYTQGGSNDSSGSCGTRTFTVPIIGDTNVEGNENFYINLTNPTTSNATYPATISDNQAIGTLNNDDIAQTPPTMGNIPDKTATVGTAFTMSPAISTYVTDPNGDAIIGYTLTGSVPGLIFNTTTGAFSGTPTTKGSYLLGAKATDNDGDSNEDTFTITVNGTPPTMGNVPNQTATVGTAFVMSPAISTYVTLTNGDAVTAYTLTGSVPGLTFNTTTGSFSGTPTTGGTYNLSVTATDEDGTSSSDSFTVTVGSPPVMGNVLNQTATEGVLYTLNIAPYVTLTNGDPILEYNLTGSLPAGLDFNSTTGVISGTPMTAASAVTLSVTATDNDGTSNSDSFTITVNPPNADLSITKTAPATAKINNTIQYTISVGNNGPSTTDNITVTDALPASVTYQTSYGVDWICTYTSATRTVSCVHPTDLLSGGTADNITIVVVAPATAQTVTNTASVASPLPDYTSANNTSSGSTTVSTTPFSSSNERAFTLQKQYNINGNMKTIGNSMLLESDGTCAETNEDNNDISTVWANRDTDGTTWNATSADLVLPPGVDSTKIKYAALYWQGRVDSDHDDAAFWAAAKTIKFKAQGLAYQTLTSADSKYNWTLRSSDANYQGGLDVTDIIKNSINTVSTSVIDSTGFTGTFWGANVQAEQMTNGFGAWSLVVIYEDYDDTLKNISLYDGYISVDNGETIPTTLSGFLTPTSGPVESDFMIFAGEGDVTLTDSVTMSNSSGDQSLGSNVFNSSQTIDGVSVTARNPACQNTIGIDIDSFNVGTTSATTPIIRNNQTSTIVKLKSTGDVYYPGAFAFSTQLYVPDVCYLEDVTFNGSPITTSNLPETDDDVEFEVTITNKDNEAAKGVFIEKVFDRPNEITYVPGSMRIAPIPGTTYSAKTDNIGDDTAEFATDTNTTKYLLGAGAEWYEGGTIVKDAITKFKYQAKIGDQNASENTYLVSYRNDLLHITFSGLPIRKCVDFNNSFGVYVPILGKYNTVRANAVDRVNGPDPIDPLDVKNALYTQIVNKPFDVDVISFANDNITPANYTGDLNLTIVELPNSGLCDDANTTLSAVYSLHYTNEKYKEVSVTPTKASKNAVFKMVTSTANLCSRDRFAIRPASYSMDANESTLVGNRTYQFSFIAHHDGAVGTPSANYNQVIDNFGSEKNATIQLDIPTGCGLANPVEFTSIPLPFSEGQVNGLISYPNIGDINLTITDNHWSAVDYESSKGDCIVNSASNIPDGNLKVGCMAKSSKIFSFIPDRFNSTLTLANGSNNGVFTYLSDERNMSAPLTLSTTAVLDGGGTATNYTANCFARDVNTTIALTNNQILSWSDTQTRIRFFDDLNSTSQFISQTGNQANFQTSDGNFTNGVAGITFRFNFDRNETRTDNPFNIARNDFNITQIIDDDGVSGSDFNRLNDMNASFIYGRIIPRDVRVFGNAAFVANAWYEVYNVPSLNGTFLASSKNDAMWYINNLHNDINDGDANVTVIIPTTPLPNDPSAIGGIETFQFSAITSIPYSGKAHINVDPWLWYGTNALGYLNPNSTTNLDCLTHPCFNITVVPSIGATGSAKSTNETTKGSKKTDSEGGASGWKSTSDYAPAIR